MLSYRGCLSKPRLFARSSQEAYLVQDRTCVAATQAAKAARDQQLKDIVEAAATHPPEGGGVITRIDLRDVAVVQSPAAEEGLPGLAEE